MALSFLPVDRDQRFLLPPDMRDWLAEDHVVWFLIELVESLDLSALEGRYRLGRQGRAPYHPAMLLTLLLYAYSQGVRSSRKIEARCRSDIAYRVICGTYQATPDHVTICRFRQAYEATIEDLFVQVLVVCERLGLLPLGVIALDGTKLEADAALGANRTVGAIRAEIARILAEHAATDATEAARYGGRCGDEVPEDMVKPQSRAARLADALAYAEGVLGAEGDSARVNVTDPHSRAMHSTDGYVQGYNAQAVAGEGGVILAGRVTNDCNDKGLLLPMWEALAETLAAAGIDRRPDLLLADAGYFCTDDLAQLAADPDAPDTLVATGARHPRSEQRQADAERAAAETEAAWATVRAEQARRAAVFERIAAGEIDRPAARAELGLSKGQLNRAYKAWRHGGPDAIPVPGRRRLCRKPPAPPEPPAAEPKADAVADHQAELAAIEAERAAEQARRAAAFERVARDELSLHNAADELGISYTQTLEGYRAWKRGGTEAVPARRRRARTRPPPPAAVQRHQMDAKLAKPANRELYKLRSPLAETPFATIKHQRNGRWLYRRGLTAANAEFLLDCLLTNVLKIRAGLTALTGILAGGAMQVP